MKGVNMFTFSNQYSTASGDRGFNTDDATLQTEWMQYHNEITRNSPALNHFGTDLNDANGGCIRNSLIEWLWSLIHDKLPAPAENHIHNLFLRYSKRSFSTDEANSATYIKRYDTINAEPTLYEGTADKNFGIDILHIVKGQKAIDYFHDKYATQEIPSVGTILTEDRYT
jgi:hypothetical protein